MSKSTPSPKKPARRRIVVVDDHPLVRRGLVGMIENEPDLQVCGQAGTRSSGLEAISSHCPDLVTVDLSLHNSDGLELIKDIRVQHSELPVLVISMHDELVYAERAFRAGARGYVNKEELGETVLTAIRCLLDGGQYMSPRMGAWFAQQYLAGHTRQPASLVTALSDRELSVFRLLGQNKTRGEIARTLHMSVKTVESHRAHIKQKLKLNSGAELLQRATHWVITGREE